MASPAQIIANHTNAQHSTGPNTEEGKRASSRNATRHGLTGKQIVIPGEDASAYEQMRQGLYQAYMPANEPERILVDQVAANAWRLARAQRVEAAFFRQLAEFSRDAVDAIAAAFIDRPAELVRVQRYVAAANSAYYKAIQQLEKTQKDRAAAEYEAAMMQTLRPSAPTPEEIGFVSQEYSNAGQSPWTAGDASSPSAFISSRLTDNRLARAEYDVRGDLL